MKSEHLVTFICDLENAGYIKVLKSIPSSVIEKARDDAIEVHKGAEEYHKDNLLDDPHYLTMKKSVVRWAIIENMITILAIVGLFYWTKSAWSFLLLLNINGIKSNFKRK